MWVLGEGSPQDMAHPQGWDPCLIRKVALPAPRPEVSRGWVGLDQVAGGSLPGRPQPGLWGGVDGRGGGWKHLGV